jgi:hypothetical protein
MAIDDDRSLARSSHAASDFASEVSLRRAKLKAMVTIAVAGMSSYVAIAAILVWWAIERPDHMDAILYIMYPVLALPVLTLVSTWHRIRKIDV